MAQKMLIDATHAEETRVVVVDGNKVEEFDFETASRRQIAGNIYLAKVTRVEPSLQAAFVDYGGNRHGFLAFNEIHPDYYQIPAADRAALLEEERVMAREQDDDERREDRRAAGGGGAPRPEKTGGRKPRRSSNRSRPAAKAENVGSDDAVETGDIAGMDIFDHDSSEDLLLDDGFGAAIGSPDAPEVDVPPAEVSSETDADDKGGAVIDDLVDSAADAPSETGLTADEQGSDSADAAEAPYRAADHAAENDDQIESISDGGDATEEYQMRRKPRARRYKIQEVIRVRQIMLVQVVKEERGNKGAALTTYLSLAGRYCVLMPNTARGGGISRKITNAADRQKLKAIANEIEVPDGAGLIIRTAGSNRTKPEIKRDYEYLFRLWEQIRELTLKSIAPTPIYEEGSLIKRTIRDLYSKDIDEVLVEGEAGFRVAKDFMKMIMPSHAKNVKLYQDTMPLFARYQVESYLAAMFNPTVQLPSGGYIVIGVTEALVAIDINSGRATREGSIEETALKTNLEAAAEIARQLRLRDLAGLIVIDFIDMEERRNNAAVEKILKDKLKTDRARIQVGRISGFGLLEMSRQRLRPGMLEATTQPCPHCHGTGLIRSDDTMGLTILRQIEEEGTRGKSREVLVRAPAGAVNFLFNMKREHIAQIEARYGMAVRIEADPQMVSPDFTIEKFKTATRVAAPVVPSAVVSLDASYMSDDDIEDDVDDIEDAEIAEAGTTSQSDTQVVADDGTGDQPRKKKRRRRRRRGGKDTALENGDTSDQADNDDSDDDSADADTNAQSSDVATKSSDASEAPVETGDEVVAAKPRRTRKPRAKAGAVVAPTIDVADAPEATEEPKAPAKRKRAPRKPKVADAVVETDVATADLAPTLAEPAPVATEAATVDASDDSPVVAQADAPAPVVADEAPKAAPVAEVAEVTAPVDDAVETPLASGEAVPLAETVSDQAATSTSDEPKRKGWWSR